jgi:hypothetical protein
MFGSACCEKFRFFGRHGSTFDDDAAGTRRLLLWKRDLFSAQLKGLLLGASDLCASVLNKLHLEDEAPPDYVHSRASINRQTTRLWALLPIFDCKEKNNCIRSHS